MNISKRDALQWFSFFAEMSEAGEELTPKQLEIAYAVISQLEKAAEKLHAGLLSQIPDLQSLNGRTYYVGAKERFPKGCISCLLGSGLGAVRRTNRCNAACPFCYDYGVLDQIPPIGEGL